MKLSEKDVKHVADLARLTLTQEELKKFRQQLSEVVNYVSELNQVDTEDIEPTSQTTGLVNVFRPDSKPAFHLSPEEALSETKETHNNYFLVPQIISKDTKE